MTPGFACRRTGGLVHSTKHSSFYINNRIIDGDSTPEERLEEIRRAFREYGTLGKRWFPFYIPSVTARFEEYIGNVYQVSGTAGSGDWNLWKALDK